MQTCAGIREGLSNCLSDTAARSGHYDGLAVKSNHERDSQSINTKPGCGTLGCELDPYSSRVRRALDGPHIIGAPWVVDEKHPFAVWKLPHHLHSMMMDFDLLAVLIDPGDQPL